MDILLWPQRLHRLQDNHANASCRSDRLATWEKLPAFHISKDSTENVRVLAV